MIDEACDEGGDDVRIGLLAGEVEAERQLEPAAILVRCVVGPE